MDFISSLDYDFLLKLIAFLFFAFLFVFFISLLDFAYNKFYRFFSISLFLK